MLTTKHEMRVLYVLRKHGGRAQHSQISQAMHRVDAKDRDTALSNCETLKLSSSAKTPANKSRGDLVYWLTAARLAYCHGPIASDSCIVAALRCHGVK